MYERNRSQNGPQYGGDRAFSPVKEGEELDVTIESVGEKGDGIAKVDGFVIFVPNTKAGEIVKIRVTKVLRKVGFAEAIGKAEAPGKNKPEEENSSEQESTESDTEENSSEDEQVEDSEDF